MRVSFTRNATHPVIDISPWGLHQQWPAQLVFLFFLAAVLATCWPLECVPLAGRCWPLFVGCWPPAQLADRVALPAHTQAFFKSLSSNLHHNGLTFVNQAPRTMVCGVHTGLIGQHAFFCVACRTCTRSYHIP
jgi:hypothetical protein